MEDFDGLVEASDRLMPGSKVMLVGPIPGGKIYVDVPRYVKGVTAAKGLALETNLKPLRVIP